MAEVRLETERLILRSWRDQDREPFAGICADPKVMATLGPVMSRAQTDALIDWAIGHEAEFGHTFWALERRGDSRLVGWCGAIRGDAGPIDQKPELGWRLASDCWGQGYATEAARAGLAWCAANLPDPDVWAITWRGNLRSRAVMERLGMRYRADLDFLHPRLDQGDPLQPHVAYSLEYDV
ncbi:MAG: GNAT family N-acetyltransferase [Proteobacteria bacterium]|nr:GNAT family N-acetyltransferase [Pseudomonadota bacterium]